MGEFSYVQSLYSERKMVDFPTYASIEDGRFLESFPRSQVDYVLIAPPIREVRTSNLDAWASRLKAALIEHPDQFELVADSPADGVQVFRVMYR